MSYIDLFVLEGTRSTALKKSKSKKPDFMLDIRGKKRDLYFFYAGLKRPSCKSIFQEENDFVKLLKIMKTSVDNQVTLGMGNPVSLGLLCEGFSCSPYQMKLAQEDIIYLATCLRQFLFVKSPSMILNIIPAAEVFGIYHIYIIGRIESFKERHNVKKQKRAKRIKKAHEDHFPRKRDLYWS
ncbi:MAG: hypothetical protein EXX96DRAFT_651228 [Benjaminiella poitrasii]|nr:MAG: hypothetical protein EXX96DRAFT_651228 [Benjaminiella poitrasii]